MNPQKTKIPVKNIAIGSVLIGVLIITYFVFKKVTQVNTSSDGAVVVDSVQTADVVEAKVIRTVRELNDLKSAVEINAAVFSSTAFRVLEDFSVVVPTELVGRENPFVITEWRIKIKAFEDAASKKQAR